MNTVVPHAKRFLILSSSLCFPQGIFEYTVHTYGSTSALNLNLSTLLRPARGFCLRKYWLPYKIVKYENDQALEMIWRKTYT